MRARNAWLAVSLWATAAAGEPISIRALFENPTISSPALSPDGKRIAFLISQGDRQIVAVRQTLGGPIAGLGKFEDPRIRFGSLRWAKPDVLWVTNDRPNPYAIGMRDRASELFAIALADGRTRYLGWMPDVAHWLPDDPANVLIDDWGRVRRMRASDGKIFKGLVQARKQKIVDWWADDTGALRAGVTVIGDEYQIWARSEPEGELRRVGSFDVMKEHGPILVAFHDDPKRLYVADQHDGRTALFTLNVDTGERTLVFAHPHVDVEAVFFAPGTQRVVGAVYVDDRHHLEFFDAGAKRLHEATRSELSRVLGRRVEFLPIGADRSGKLRLLFASSDTQPPTYFLFDGSDNTVVKLFDGYPNVDLGSVAATERVTYQTRDGLRISAFLTLPPDREPKRLPLVVLPHGGPRERDEIDWNPELQLFASRGFAVLQMNFRGSEGYGRAFEEAGNREWGGKMQDDITDGVRFAIETGVADPDRIGIYGGSYGGYAALMGLVRTPELYRAGAAYAGVSDLPSMLADDRWYGRWVVEKNREQVGGGWGDRARLRELSPRRRAAAIRAPLLLGHGEADGNVHVEHSREMAAALRKAGKTFEYLEFEHEIHGFALEANRIRWYEALIAFFEKNLAPRDAARNAAAEPEPAAAP